MIQDEEFPLKTIMLLHGKKFSSKFLHELALGKCVVAVT